MSDLVASIRNKEAIVLACRIPTHFQTKLMLSAIEAAITNNYDSSNEVQSFSELSGLSADDVLQLLGLYISLVRLYMETDEKQFLEVMQRAGFSVEFVDKFPLKHKMLPVSVILSGSYRGIQKLSSFKWRVDISFACGVLKKQVPPTVIISLVVNGQKHVLEFDLFTFHRLRFNVSLAFKEFMIIKKSNVLKNMSLSLS